MIQLDHITIKTKPKNILKDISYTYKKGSCTAIIGNNGAGKTCLLKTIIGQIQPQNGHTTCQGTISYAPDHIQFPDELSIQQLGNIDNQWIARLGFTQYIDTKYKNLSQGNKQKTNLIYSLSQDADIYIRDEPTQHLDPESRYIVHDILTALKKQGKTIIYTTHFLEDIGAHTDVCMILQQGTIQQIITQPDISKLSAHFQKTKTKK